MDTDLLFFSATTEFSSHSSHFLSVSQQLDPLRWVSTRSSKTVAIAFSSMLIVSNEPFLRLLLLFFQTIGPMTGSECKKKRLFRHLIQIFAVACQRQFPRLSVLSCSSRYLSTIIITRSMAHLFHRFHLLSVKTVTAVLTKNKLMHPAVYLITEYFSSFGH